MSNIIWKEKEIKYSGYDNVAYSIELAADFSSNINENDNEFLYKAIVKYDGCIHFYIHSGCGNGEYDYLHICEIDILIDALQKLRDKAKEHFGQEWK